jgi:hypothetical protein
MGLCVGEQEKVLPRVWMYRRSMQNSQCEQKAMHNTEEASKIWMVEVPKTVA